MADACDDNDLVENELARTDPADTRAPRKYEAYAVGVETRTCYNCQEAGHIQRYCPFRRRQPWPQQQETDKTHYGPEKKPEQPEKKPERPVKMPERPVKMPESNKVHYGNTVCVLCHLSGHLAPGCPSRRRASWDV